MESVVSVIVPIYNVEDYLCRCVDSILRQTYKKLEIILVDDGSEDRCGKLCDEYAQKESRIKVIHKENGGLSDARNAGLEIAVGDYVFFVDSDDWIADNAIECLLAMFSKYDDVDIVMGSSVDVIEQEGENVETKYSVKLGSEEKLDKIKAMKDNLLNGWAAWNKLYRRKLFDEIRFPVGKINEDEAILLRVIEKSDNIIKVGIPTYFYFLRQNSITTSQFSERKMDWLDNCIDNYRYIKEKHADLLPEAEYRLECCVIYLLQFMLLESERFSEQIKRLDGVLNEHYESMRQNRYSSKAQNRRICFFRMILKYHIEKVYSIVYQGYRKLRWGK